MDYKRIGIFCLHCDEIASLKINKTLTIEGYKITKKKNKKTDNCSMCGFFEACDIINSDCNRCDGGEFIYKMEVE